MAESNQKDNLFQVTLPSGRTYGYWEISGLRFPIFDTVIKEFDPRPILVKLPEMKGREDDVIVCGCHRSGTNWTWEIVNMLIYQQAEYQKDRKSPTLLEFQSQEYFSKMESPRILSTHLRFNHIPKDMKQKKCKIVYIQRNPKDVTASFYNYWKSEFGVEFLWDDFIHMFLHSDEAMYNSWIGATKSWEQAMKDNPDYPIHLIFYEDIKQNPAKEITKLAKFLQVPSDEEFIKSVVDRISFTNMKKAKLNFLSNDENVKSTNENTIQRREKYYRKGEVGDWKNYFTVAEDEYFDRILAEKMKDSVLEFKYQI